MPPELDADRPPLVGEGEGFTPWLSLKDSAGQRFDPVLITPWGGLLPSRYAVVEMPGGAHPSSMPPAYGWDMKAFRAYSDAAWDRDRGYISEVMEENSSERGSFWDMW